MQERHLHGVADALDLFVQTADVVEGDVRSLLKHQIGVILDGNQGQREADGGIHAHPIAGIDVLLGECAGTAYQRDVASTVGHQQTTVVKNLSDGAHRTQGVGVMLIHYHHVLVEQHRTSRLQTRRLYVRRHRYDHAPRARNHLGAGVLHPLFVGVRRMHAYHGGESHGRPGQLIQLRLGLGEFLRGTGQCLRQRMVLGHQPVIGLTEGPQPLILPFHADPRFLRFTVQNTHCPNAFRQSKPCLKKKR